VGLFFSPSFSAGDWCACLFSHYRPLRCGWAQNAFRLWTGCLCFSTFMIGIASRSSIFCVEGSLKEVHRNGKKKDQRRVFAESFMISFVFLRDVFREGRKKSSPSDVFRSLNFLFCASHLLFERSRIFPFLPSFLTSALSIIFSPKTSPFCEFFFFSPDLFPPPYNLLEDFHWWYTCLLKASLFHSLPLNGFLYDLDRLRTRSFSSSPDKPLFPLSLFISPPKIGDRTPYVGKRDQVSPKTPCLPPFSLPRTHRKFLTIDPPIFSFSSKWSAPQSLREFPVSHSISLTKIKEA